MEIKILQFHTEKELSIVQFVNAHPDTFDYIGISEAMEKNLIEVKELSRSGDVNNLMVYNLAGADIFNRRDIYADYFSKILKSAASEAFYLKKKKGSFTEVEASFKTKSFFDKIEELESNEFDGVGIGTEKRFENNQITGFELNYKNNLIHFSAMSTNIDITE